MGRAGATSCGGICVHAQCRDRLEQRSRLPHNFRSGQVSDAARHGENALPGPSTTNRSTTNRKTKIVSRSQGLSRVEFHVRVALRVQQSPTIEAEKQRKVFRCTSPETEHVVSSLNRLAASKFTAANLQGGSATPLGARVYNSCRPSQLAFPLQPDSFYTPTACVGFSTSTWTHSTHPSSRRSIQA